MLRRRTWVFYNAMNHTHLFFVHTYLQMNRFFYYIYLIMFLFAILYIYVGKYKIYCKIFIIISVSLLIFLLLFLPQYFNRYFFFSFNSLFCIFLGLFVTYLFPNSQTILLLFYIFWQNVSKLFYRKLLVLKQNKSWIEHLSIKMFSEKLLISKFKHIFMT